MKISVKIDNVEIVIDEEGHTTDMTSSLKWADQQGRINETLKVMAAEAEKLQKVSRFIPNPIPVSAHGQPGDGE